MLRITALDNLTPENNVQFSAGYAAWLKEVLGVEADRGYITFLDPSEFSRVLLLSLGLQYWGCFYGC